MARRVGLGLLAAVFLPLSTRALMARRVGLGLLAAAASSAAAAAVPSIVDLTPAPAKEMPLQGMPIVQNFWGAVGLRHDMLSLGTMALTPYNGNFQNGSLLIDGLPALTDSTQWSPCEGVRTGSAGVVGVLNAVRMPFEAYAVQQSWTLTLPDAATTATTISANLDGPFFRFCDVQGQGPCGWGTVFPIDRSSFTATVDTTTVNGVDYQVMVTVDSVTGVAAASVLFFRGGSPPGGPTLTVSAVPSNSTFQMLAQIPASPSSPSVVILQQAMAVANNSGAAVAAVVDYLGDAAFAAAWDGACTDWEARWQSAFAVPAADGGTGTHFSGNLPTLSSSDPSIDRLYYWSALAMVSLERTNYYARPRTYVISQGPSNSLDGQQGMGGSGQFSWDMSFAAVALSLLDPEHASEVLTFILQTSDLSPPPSAGMSVLVPQYWDAFPPYGSTAPALGSYRFDFYSAYLFLLAHTTVNNATDWLSSPVASLVHPNTTLTGVDYLKALTSSWTGFPASPVSPWLADYGPDKRDYLEVVPMYVDVVPALQMGNVGMALATARLLEQLAGGSNASAPAVAELRANASAILAAAVAHLWEDADDGVWRCMYPNGTSQAVRSVTDYVYVAQALGYMGRNGTSGGGNPAGLPASVSELSQSFFWGEVLSNGTAWVRALSLADPQCADVMNPNATIEDLLVCRADWGCFGSYGGIPGFAVESSVHLTGTFGDMVRALQQMAPTAAVAAPSQGIALGTPTYFALHHNGDHAVDDVPTPPFSPSFPEYFDEPGWELFWPSTLRYVQNAEASFVDAIVRTLFGWRPEWVTPSAPANSTEAAAIIDAALFLPDVPRTGFSGTLSWLRTPLGYVNISAGENGLSWVWA
jgi:hypothetical protein